MSRPPTIRVHLFRAMKRSVPLATVCGVFSLLQVGHSQTPVVLDRVVAVVNRQAILASDIDEEIRLSVLDSARSGQTELTRQRALDQLISRMLIQQQIRRDDLVAVEPTRDEVNARVQDLRKELPECVHQNCASDAGWSAFLAAHHLTEDRVATYFRYRLEILGFIEQRFRSGIHIPQQDIDNYYREALLPQYKPGEEVPSLEKVAPRIEEILLQQQVNILFDEWLTNLRNQGDVEVLDPSLEKSKNEVGTQKQPLGAEGSR
jgi:peptidyl-prolyl cis-trans isomerase SurA